MNNTKTPITEGPETEQGMRAALATLSTWCQIERGKLSVDGYDYKSGEEFGIRRVELQIEKAIAASGALSEGERHAIGHARYQVAHASPENPDCTFDYGLVEALLKVIDRALASGEKRELTTRAADD